MQSYINKKIVLLTCVALILFLCGLAGAATVTWTGGGSDNDVSTAANWSGNEAPQDGDNVVFNSTAIDCIWDLNVTLASFTILSGYTGNVAIESSTTLIIAKVKTWTGLGSDNKASTSENWSGNQVPQSGDKVVFDDTSAKNASWDLPDITPGLLTVSSGYSGEIALSNPVSIAGNLTVSGGIFDLNNKDLNVDGNILIASGGIINATSSTITLKGDWRNFGIFIPGTSIVVLEGANRIIYGDTTFYNLVKTVTSADTLYFEAGSTQTIINNLTLQGSVDNLLSLRSTVDDSYWYIGTQGPRNILYVNMKDSYNLGSTVTIILDSIDVGNNINMYFGEDCVCIPLPGILSNSIFQMKIEGLNET